VKYRFRSAKSFRRALTGLNPKQKQAAKAAFRIFKENPFDPRLRTHKIHKLSAAHGKTIYSAWIEADLRAVFYLEGSTVWSVDIGTHAIYRG
jgi:mRNA-degrading endonuclease YafQ of YafQ-DinJ toxin-antitoxin module